MRSSRACNTSHDHAVNCRESLDIRPAESGAVFRKAFEVRSGRDLVRRAFDAANTLRHRPTSPSVTLLALAGLDLIVQPALLEIRL